MQKRKLTPYQKDVIHDKTQRLKKGETGLTREDCRHVTQLMVEEDLAEEAGQLFDRIWPNTT